jgi:hypothetical protein
VIVKEFREPITPNRMRTHEAENVSGRGGSDEQARAGHASGGISVRRLKRVPYNFHEHALLRVQELCVVTVDVEQFVLKSIDVSQNSRRWCRRHVFPK